MNDARIISLVVVICLCSIGIVKSLITIIRLETAEVIWGEIIVFRYIGVPEHKPYEDPEPPDYFIEVKYEYEGETYVTNSVIKKDIHYERGGKIKILLPKGEIDSAIVDYNIKIAAYTSLIFAVIVAVGVAIGIYYLGGQRKA